MLKLPAETGSELAVPVGTWGSGFNVFSFSPLCFKWLGHSVVKRKAPTSSQGRCPSTRRGIELPPRQALPYPWQEKQGTLDSVLWATELIRVEHKRRCDTCSGSHKKAPAHWRSRCMPRTWERPPRKRFLFPGRRTRERLFQSYGQKAAARLSRSAVAPCVEALRPMCSCCGMCCSL